MYMFFSFGSRLCEYTYEHLYRHLFLRTPFGGCTLRTVKQYRPLALAQPNTVAVLTTLADPNIMNTSLNVHEDKVFVQGVRTRCSYKRAAERCSYKVFVMLLVHVRRRKSVGAPKKSYNS